MTINVIAIQNELGKRSAANQAGQPFGPISVLEGLLLSANVNDVGDLTMLLGVAQNNGDAEAEKLIADLIQLLKSTPQPVGKKLHRTPGRMVDRGPGKTKRWKDGEWSYK